MDMMLAVMTGLGFGIGLTHFLIWFFDGDGLWLKSSVLFISIGTGAVIALGIVT